MLPGPLLVAETLWRDGPSLLGSLLVTLRITLAALAAAVVLGGALAILFAAVAAAGDQPLSLCRDPAGDADRGDRAADHHLGEGRLFLSLLVCAWIVAFFPVVANTTLGLNSADRNLVDLFRLYGASRWQTLRFLRLPSALPYFLAGMRISGGLALIGAVVAEFVAGTGGSDSGLASRILEAGYRLQMPRLFAALLLLSLTGIAIFAVLGWLAQHLIGHWHESALSRDD